MSYEFNDKLYSEWVVPETQAAMLSEAKETVAAAMAILDKANKASSLREIGAAVEELRKVLAPIR